MMGQSDSSKLYGFYHFTSFKTRKEKKKKKSKFIMMGEVLAAPGLGRRSPGNV